MSTPTQKDDDLFILPEDWASLDFEDVSKKAENNSDQITTIDENPDDFAYGIVGDIEIFVDAAIDADALEDEKNRILAQIEDKKSYLRGITAKLSNASFVKNAPEKIVRAEMEKRRQAEEQLEKFEEKLRNIESRLK